MRQYVDRSILLVSVVLSAIFFSFIGIAPAQAQTDRKIPIEIKGKKIYMDKGLTRQAVKDATAPVFATEPSVDDEETLQYDVVLVPEQAPVTFVFSFDGQKNLSGLLIDAFEKKQNPPVQALAAWLTANAGKPATLRKGESVWKYDGWKIVHRFGGTGEDSTYSMEILLEK